jgi:hypothetical protein
MACRSRVHSSFSVMIARSPREIEGGRSALGARGSLTWSKPHGELMAGPRAVRPGRSRRLTGHEGISLQAATLRTPFQRRGQANRAQDERIAHGLQRKIDEL